ncbi:MAG TPA: EAL domain-containing protein [Oscillospiraceae bacterium]|nr:EAL domain-containing protein [Oscillospiraceae bacterium]
MLLTGVVHADSLGAGRDLFHGIFAGVPEGAAVLRLKTCGGGYALCRLSYRSLPDTDGRPYQAIGLISPLESEGDMRFAFEQESRFVSLVTCDLIAAARINLTRNHAEWVTIDGLDDGLLAQMDTYDKVAGWLLGRMPNSEERSVLQQRLNCSALSALAASGTGFFSEELRVTDESGRILWAERAVRLLHDPQTGDLYQFLYLRSIERMKKRVLALGIRAERDAASLLFSRASFQRLAESILADARDGKGRFAVMILRVDNVPELTARFGRSGADALVLSITRKLRAGLSNRHLAGRDTDGSILLFFDDIPDEAWLRETCTQLFNLLGNPLYYLVPAEHDAVLLAGAAILPARCAEISLLRAGANEALSRANASRSLVILGEEETLAGAGILPASRPVLNAAADLFVREDPSTAEAFARCTQLLLSGGDLDTAIHRVLEVIGAHCGADRAYVFQLRDNGVTLEGTHEWHAAGAPSRPGPLPRFSPGDFPPFAELFRTAQGFFLQDVSTLTPGVGGVPAYMEGVRSLCAAPLVHRQSVYGFIGVDNPAAPAGTLTLLTFVSYFMISELFANRSAARHAYLSSHDLPTGTLLRDRFLTLAERSKTQPFSSVGILMADINALQALNRNYGSNYGDKAIARLARTLQVHFGEDCVYRYAGGTFLAACPDIAYDAFLSQVRAARADLDQNADFDTSFGYTWSDTTSDTEKLVADADELMRAEKREGGKAEDARRGAVRSKVLRSLEESIRRGDVLAYLQPRVKAEGGALSGAEALARIRRPGNGLMLPGQFIPRLESLGLVRYIDLHILGEVCRLLARWRDAGKPLFPISVNFSRATVLEPGIVRTVLDIVDRHRLDHALIEIEITETLGEFEWTTVAEIGGKLSAAGFRLALDDFGARYSNLSIIAALDFSLIKLDKSLVDRLLSSAKSRMLVGTVIDAAARFGIQTVAEGVESAEQLAVLRQLRCTEIQGCLINKPLPAEEFEAVCLQL